MTNLNAIFSLELNELVLDDGRVVKVPDLIANTVSSQDHDTRFVRNWAVMSNLIPIHGEVGVIQA